MRSANLAGLAATLLFLLAGCQSRTDPYLTPSSSASPTGATDACAAYAPPTFQSDDSFSGANAFAHVLRLTCDFSTAPARVQARVPGTPEREAAGVYLERGLREAGWSASWQNFTGEDYDALDKGSVSLWAEAADCASGSKRDRMLGLQFSNVVASRGTGNDVWILMAHYDSKRFASKETDANLRQEPVPGANDGASGVGVLAEAARVITTVDDAVTVRILLVDGEDGFEDCHPLAGSVQYAAALPDLELQRIRGVLLLDMVGDPEARYCLATNSSPLRDRLVEAAATAGVAPVRDAPACSVADDHTAFMDRNVPALDLIDYKRPGAGFPPYWHTTADTPDKLSPGMLDDVGSVVVAFVAGLTE